MEYTKIATRKEERRVSHEEERKGKVRLVDIDGKEHLWVNNIERVELDMFYYNVILSNGVKVRFPHPRIGLIEEFPYEQPKSENS